MSSPSRPLESTTTASHTQDTHEHGPPPSYTSVTTSMQNLAQGDPREIIEVPMIHSQSSRSKTVQTVVVRKMTRDLYLRKYNHNTNGDYIGTEPAAPDAGLVFNPSRGSSADLIEQVKRVAFAREHEQKSWPIEGSGAMSGGGGG